MASPPPRRTRSTSPSGSAHLIGWLGHDSQAASVLATAQLHLKLRAAIGDAIPPAMRGAFEVIRLEAHALTLMVSSAAFAAKFRQIAPRVTTHLQSAGWNVNEIKLRVQGGLGLPETKKPEKASRALDQQDLRAFEELNRNLRPGPLADAVARLLAHHQPIERGVKPASTLDETLQAPPIQKSK
jgi:hypothetical protein